MTTQNIVKIKIHRNAKSYTATWAVLAVLVFLFYTFVVLSIFLRVRNNPAPSMEPLPPQTVSIDEREYNLPLYFLPAWSGLIYEGQTADYSGWISRRYFTNGYMENREDYWRDVERQLHWTKAPNRERSQIVTPTINTALKFLVDLEDAMKSVYTAQDQLIVMEIGCGCAPQLGTVAAINNRSRKLPMLLLGVEANSKKLPMFHTNMQDNSVSGLEYEIFHGTISIDSQPVNFTVEDAPPIMNIKLGKMLRYRNVDDEQPIMNHKLGKMLRYHKQMETVQTFTICQLLKSFDYIDYLYMNIQDAELEVLQQDIACISEKVRIMHIVLHNYSVYATAIELLLGNAWILKHFTPGISRGLWKLHPTKYGEQYSQDGIISAINAKFSSFHEFSVLLNN